MSKLNIHLINTPDFIDKEYQALLLFLGKVKGPMKFISPKIEENRKRHFEKNDNTLSWEQLFSECNEFRRSKKVHTNDIKVQENDFVVLLTGRKNKDDFFSFFDTNKNIFVQTSEWDSFTSSAKIYPVAYEIISNILQSLMKLSLKRPNQWVHEDPIGCINDFCDKKKEIILKLRTGDICLNCLKKMKKERVKDELIDQSLQILELVRKESQFSQGFTKNRTPEKMIVDKYGGIFIGDVKISLNAIQSSLYIFYLNHPEGVENKDLHKYKEELLKIYRKFKEINEEVIDNLTRPAIKGRSTLTTYKSDINAELKSKLNRLADFYIIDGKREQEFYVPLIKNQFTRDLITINLFK